MRIKISVSLIFIFTFLVLNAYAILDPRDIWWDGEGSLVDALINASIGNIPMPEFITPQEERAIEWKNSSILKTPTVQSRRINTLSDWVAERNQPADRSKSPIRVEESFAALMSDTTVAGSRVETQNPTPSANLAGFWSLDLNDTPSKQVLLTLFQVEDNVLGSGSMKDGNDVLVVTASGALKEDQIYLDISSVCNISLYRLVMTSTGDRGDFVSGDYKAYMPDGRTWMGKVQGRRSLLTS